MLQLNQIVGPCYPENWEAKFIRIYFSDYYFKLLIKFVKKKKKEKVEQVARLGEFFEVDQKRSLQDCHLLINLTASESPPFLLTSVLTPPMDAIYKSPVWKLKLKAIEVCTFFSAIFQLFL